MRMTESKLRHTIRRAILIAEGKKEAKKLAKKIKKYVKSEHNRDPEEAFANCSPDALKEKFSAEASDQEIDAALERLEGMLHGGPQDGYWYQ